MPRISVICIAKDEREFSRLREKLSKQTFQDFEFVSSTAPSIPRAWNEALAKAKGEILVFTESDAYPLYDSWLEEIVEIAESGSAIKGLEVNPTDPDMCNLVVYSETLGDLKFDETYPIGEDTDFFARLKSRAISLKQTDGFPVVHAPSISWKKTVQRAFQAGRLSAKAVTIHGKENTPNVNDRFPPTNYIHPISNRVRIVAENILFLGGLSIGFVLYLPAKLLRTIQTFRTRSSSKSPRRVRRKGI